MLKERIPNPDEIIKFNNDDEFYYPHSSHDDDVELVDSFVVEYKVLTNSSGTRIKTEKGYWQKEEEIKAKRIKVRHKKVA